MPGRLSRCFTGRWNENRFREAEVNRIVAVWRFQEAGGGSGSLGGEIPIQRPGTTKCLTRESVTTPSGALCCENQRPRVQGNVNSRERGSKGAKEQPVLQALAPRSSNREKCQAAATARELTALPGLRPQFRNSLWSGPLQPLLYRDRRIVPSFRV